MDNNLFDYITENQQDWKILFEKQKKAISLAKNRQEKKRAREKKLLNENSIAITITPNIIISNPIV